MSEHEPINKTTTKSDIFKIGGIIIPRQTIEEIFVLHSEAEKAKEVEIRQADHLVLGKPETRKLKRGERFLTYKPTSGILRKIASFFTK